MKKYAYLLCSALFAVRVSAMGSMPMTHEEATKHAIKTYGLPTKPELKGFFSDAGVDYPPKQLALLAFKKEQKLELWAQKSKHNWEHIHTYPFTAYSGHLGPKLKERDRQIPEGIYKLVGFNPNSSMHLSMRVNYPNQFDRQKAKHDGRRKLGGDIYLHGSDQSVGCLAIGDDAISQLFMLAHEVGLKNIQLIIAPNDLRKEVAQTELKNQPRWVPDLYRRINRALKAYS